MFTLTFNTDNAAFEDNPLGLKGEVARILSEVSLKILSDATAGKIKDANGNTVGSFSLEEA